MNRKTMLLVLSLVLLLAAAAALYRLLLPQVQMQNLAAGETEPSRTEEASPAETEPANLAPDFTVYDREGNAHSLSDFRGEPVIVNFWASWCGPCRGEMPAFQEKYEQYGQQIRFLMVNRTDGVRETVQSASSYVEEGGYTFPLYFDLDNSGAIAYGVNGIPATFFVGADGSLVAYGKAALTAETLQRGIDMLLE